MSWRRVRANQPKKRRRSPFRSLCVCRCRIARSGKAAADRFRVASVLPPLLTRQSMRPGAGASVRAFASLGFLHEGGSRKPAYLSFWMISLCSSLRTQRHAVRMVTPLRPSLTPFHALAASRISWFRLTRWRSCSTSRSNRRAISNFTNRCSSIGAVCCRIDGDYAFWSSVIFAVKEEPPRHLWHSARRG